MKFHKLKNSIELNAAEQPDVYSAVCMVEALFQDIKDESGHSIKDIPSGDERLPTKLVWMCRLIEQIYSANSAGFTRSRDMLDEKMERVKKLEAELDAYSDDAARLSAAKASALRLEEKLRAVRNDKQEYEALVSRCSSIEAELEELSGFDKGDAALRLEELENRKREIVAENSGYIAAMRNAENEFAELRHSVAENKARYNAACAELEREKNECSAISELIVTIHADIDAMENKKSETAAEKDLLVSKRAALQHKLDALESENAGYYAEIIQPLEEKLGELKTEIDKHEETKLGLSNSYKKLKQKCDELTFSIALMKTDIEDANKSLAEKQQQLTEKQQYRDECLENAKAADGEISAIAEELSRLQAEIEAAESTRLPAARQLEEQSSRRFSELSEQLEEISRETDRLNESIPQLETELEAKRAVYDALTANYNTKSDEIGALKSKIDELRGKTDEEKHNSYKLQLKNDMDKLNERIRECGELEESIQRLEKELVAAEAEQQRLSDIKSSHELAKQKIDTLVKDLKYVDADEYLGRVSNVKNRLELMSAAHEMLTASLAMIQNSLGIQYESESDLEKVRQGISQIEECADMLRDALVRCASCIKMEEK